VPGIRNPLQIYFNKGFSFINWVKVEDEPQSLDLRQFALLSPTQEQIEGTALQDKVLFVNFWATWCPPCIAEMPSIQELKDAYGDQVEFILISNEPFEITGKFLDQKSYDFLSYQPLKLPEIFQSRSIPRTFIINGKSEIVVDKSGAVNWNSDKVRAILEELLLTGAAPI